MAVPEKQVRSLSIYGATDKAGVALFGSWAYGR